MRNRWIRWITPVVLLLGIGAAAWWVARPRVTEEEIRQQVVTTIERESPASFYVTGVLDVVATTRVTNTKVLLPDVLDLPLGTTETTVRLSGRVSYGFDVRRLRPEMIELEDDGVVRVTLPALEVQAVEPALDRMEVQTSVGWARLYRSSGRRVEHRAIALVQDALRQQGRAHLRDAAQPRLNTARALQALLTPVLQAAGLDEPRFRFQIGPELVLAPEG